MPRRGAGGQELTPDIGRWDNRVYGDRPPMDFEIISGPTAGSVDEQSRQINSGSQFIATKPANMAVG